MIDPHNIAARPRSIGNLTKSVVVSLALVFSIAIANNSYASVMLGIALGTVVGPAINSPHVTRPDEEPSWVKRKLEDFRVWAGGALLKTLVIIPATLVLNQFRVADAWFVALGILAVLLNFAKTKPVMDVIRISPLAPPDRLLGVPLAIALPRVIRLSFIGNLALSIWLYLLYVGPENLEKAKLHDWLTVIAGVLAALASALT
jgi:hypothetical protein